MWRKILVALAALLLLAATAPAQAGPGTALLSRQATSAAELQAQIDLQLRVAPGGKQTASNEVSYDGGRFVVTYALPGVAPQAAPNCPANWYCFYDNVNFGYPRGKLSDYGRQDLGNWSWRNRTESVHNNTNTAVDFEEYTSAGYVTLFCVPAYGAISDVSPYRNRADAAYRYYSFTYC